MAKYYEPASPDVNSRIESLRKKHYAYLEDVTITSLFVFVDEDEQCLKHGGYYAAAVTKVIGTRERAAGMTDALIVIDRYVYSGLEPKQMDALLDHELYHLERVIDDKTGQPVIDVLGRPKIKLRKHDHQYGWFDVIADRHGHNSMEVMQAARLMDSAGQLYFDFKGKAA